MAGQALLALLDPEYDHYPTGGYEVAHDLGRWWDAVLRLEDTIGLVIPAELEAAALRNLRTLTDNQAHLLLNRLDIPWQREKAKLNPHNWRETILTYAGLVRRRNSAWAVEAADSLLFMLAEIIDDDGRVDMALPGRWSDLPYSADPTHDVNADGDWFDGTASGGRAIEALVELYQATGLSQALELANVLAETHVDYTVQPDGALRPELADPAHAGHTHSYLGTLRGLLRFGLLTGQRRYVDAVDATYRHAVREKLVHRSGWAPHDLGLTRFPNKQGDPVADPASCGDAAQLALWLALEAGSTDLLDDVERYVRARLIPAQMTEEDGKNLTCRQVGAWAIHGPSHGGKGCTPDVLAAVAHSLCDIQSHIVTPMEGGWKINLHLDCETPALSVQSNRDGHEASLLIEVKAPANLLIRVPDWAPLESFELIADMDDVDPIPMLGPYVMVGREMLGAGSTVEMTFDLPKQVTREVMPSGRTHTLKWLGDEIVSCKPQDKPYPFYPK